MKDGGKLPLFAAVIAALAIVGFLRGTSDTDYDLVTPLTVWEQGPDGDAVVAGRYKDAQHATTSDGAEVADECSDCHPERVTELPQGQRTEHPIGVAVRRGARLEELLASGGRLEQEEEEGPRKVVCRSCHRPHGINTDARLIVTTDEGALCVSCHADHRASASRHPVQVRMSATTRAAIEGIGGVAGNKLTCLSCHDPHGSTAGSLLRTDARGADACRLCHQDKAKALGERGHGSEDCVDCHGMHRASKKPGKGPTAPKPRDQPCLDCHSSGKGSRLQVRPDAGHPMGVDVPSDATGHEGQVSCADCHVPHSSRKKVLAETSTAVLCVQCHPAQKSVVGSDHDGSVVGAAARDGACITCHDVHDGTERPSPPPGVNPASGRCLACHDGRTKAKEVTRWDHPEGLLLTTAGLPFRYKGPIPYFGPDGRRTEDRDAGSIACQTCHDPHRWKPGSDTVEGAVEGTEQNSFLRDPKETIKLCSVCHDADGRPRFRFFHGEQFRENEGGGE